MHVGQHLFQKQLPLLIELHSFPHWQNLPDFRISPLSLSHDGCLPPAEMADRLTQGVGTEQATDVAESKQILLGKKARQTAR